MKTLWAMLIALTLTSTPAWAMLKPGDMAPNFTARASLGGKEMPFSLADALKKGPVVLYFYPAAFTKGCTVEAHNFAEATDTFAEMGATVIGVSNDKIETLNKFSVSECRNKFAVAADTDKKIMKAYRATLMGGLLGMADRTSYVITPDNRILFAYTALDPNGHVDKTLEAVRGWRALHSKAAPN
jgi:thioredoxin-dependent peroxiredoxin